MTKVCIEKLSLSKHILALLLTTLSSYLQALYVCISWVLHTAKGQPSECDSNSAHLQLQAKDFVLMIITYFNLLFHLASDTTRLMLYAYVIPTDANLEK